MRANPAIIPVLILILWIVGCSTKSESRFIDIDGKKQHIRVKGTGSPAVIFVTGLAVDLTNYDSIQNEISKVTRTFSYDRAGIGASEYIPNERSIDNMVDELNEILLKENIEPPFLLVGHSLGGFVIRLFAKAYPDKVCGLFFIDPSSEHYEKSLRAVRTDKELKTYDSIREHEMAWTEDPETQEAMRSEYENFLTRDTVLLKGISFPKDIPITILTSARFWDKEIRAGITKKDIDIWIALHRKWSADAPQIKHVITIKSGHYIHIEEPDLVIDELKSLIDLCDDE